MIFRGMGLGRVCLFLFARAVKALQCKTQTMPIGDSHKFNDEEDEWHCILSVGGVWLPDLNSQNSSTFKFFLCYV